MLNLSLSIVKDKFEINEGRLCVSIFKILSNFRFHNAQFILTFIQHSDLH